MLGEGDLVRSTIDALKDHDKLSQLTQGEYYGIWESFELRDAAIPKTDLKPRPFSPVVSVSPAFELFPVSQIASTSLSENPRSFDSTINSVGLIRKVILGSTVSA